MSMLAEHQRKQKWAVDPRNTAWSNDDSKFGQRMLEKMGWSKGKGLGAQEQGATDHIKVQVKNNHLGLGATINNEIPHTTKRRKLSASKKSPKSPKNSVHYMKFTKGNDLSCRSKTDLDCIFGKRQSKKIPEDDSSPATPDGNSSSTTTTSAFTIQEYFAKRKAELKNKPQVIAAGPDFAETQTERKNGKKRKKEAKDRKVEIYTVPKAKKKRHQVEWQLGDPCWDKNSGVSAENGEDCVWPPHVQDITLKSKKRREKKNQVEVAMDATLHDTPVKKKKKKKKGSK
uniref:G-patch domain-containing protein n=1 Tax=Canis lupus familiaris TaxID=9615 RepID=A0A8I3NHU9_CANLF